MYTDIQLNRKKISAYKSWREMKRKNEWPLFLARMRRVWKGPNMSHAIVHVIRRWNKAGYGIIIMLIEQKQS